MKRPLASRPFRPALVGALCALALAALPGHAEPVTEEVLRMAPKSDYLLRGVVGNAVSVALPARAGYEWDWDAHGDARLFAPPYRVRFMPTGEKNTPEVWTFPLTRPGKTVLEFRSMPATPIMGPWPDPETRTVRLMVLTPYEAQQHPLGDLNDSLLIK